MVRDADRTRMRLLAAATDEFAAFGIAGARIDRFRVPGAFEIPFAARQAAEKGRLAAVICLGCLIKLRLTSRDIWPRSPRSSTRKR